MTSITATASSPPPSPEDLLTLEYKLAAERYENIYKSIWQQFSYMAAVAGAILAFGGDALSTEVLIPIALVPLVFWYWATYVPIDFYGQQVRKRLASIEDQFNEKLQALGSSIQLAHYRKFNEERPRLRVKYAVTSFGLSISGLWLIWIVVVLANYLNLPPEPAFKGTKFTIQSAEVEVRAPQIEELNDTLESVSKRLDSIETLLRKASGTEQQGN